jgi:hypothetical protein
MKSVEKIESDCKVIVYFKIQQLHNIARVFFKQNNYSSAIHVNKLLLDYLLFNKAFSYNGITFLVIDNEFTELKNLFVKQVFFELISFFNYKEDNYNQYFNLCFDDIINFNDSLDSENKFVYLWIKVYSDIQNGFVLKKSDFDNFIEKSSNLGHSILLDSIYKLLTKKSKDYEVLSST